MPTTYAIIKGNQYFDATLWTGTGAAQSIVNASGFQPALVWGKSRSNAYPNVLSNLVVGATKYLVSNNTDAETTDAGYISAINSNGFSVGTSGGLNVNGGTFVGWQWKGNGSGVSNTAGSITSTVSANTTSGFSVVTYTGNAVNATVGHGLGAVPKMIIVKNRNNARLWPVYHASIGAANRLVLNTTDASAADSGTWNSTEPTSTVFSIGTSSAVNNSISDTYVAYCFAEINGYSKFGSYTGNGSTDGPFIYTGFRPRYIMIKRTDAAQSWWITDTARNPYNTCNLDLFANLSNAEENNGYNLDLLSNGVKIRTSTNDRNASGGTYIYMAFAEMPTKYANAR